MAEPTEQEQIKQTQALEKVDKTTIASKDELMKLSRILKEENQAAKQRYDAEEEHRQEEKQKSAGNAEVQEKILEFTKEIDKKAEKQEKKDAEEAEKKEKDKEKADAIKDKELNFGIKQEGFFGKFAGWTEEFAANVRDKDFADKTRFKYEGGLFTRMGKSLNMIKLGSDEAQRHGEFMEGMEKRKWNLQKTMYNMSVRAAKLALRGGKAIKDWGVKGLTNMKDKAFNWIKSLGKLLLLLGIWGAALWMDANMMKEDWEKLKVTLTEWKDKLVGWWESLTKFWEDVTKTWDKIQAWFRDELGIELELWHVALLAFGLWFGGFRIAFAIASFAAKGVFNLLKWFLGGSKTSPLRLLGIKLGLIADDVVDGGKGVNQAKKAMARTSKFYKKHGVNVTSYADELDDVAKKIDDSPNMKKGFWKTLGDKIIKMFKTTAGWFDNLLTNVTKYTTVEGHGKGSVWTNIKATMTKMFSTVGDWFSKTKGTVSTWFSNKSKGILDFGKDLLSKGKNLLGGAVDTLKSGFSKVTKIPGVKALGRLGLGAAKFVAKVITPFEAIRGGIAGWNADPDATFGQKITDSLAGATRSVADLWVGDTLELVETLGSLGKDIINDKEFGTSTTDLGSKKYKELADKYLLKVDEQSKMFADDPTGERTVLDRMFGLKMEKGETYKKQQAAAERVDSMQDNAQMMTKLGLGKKNEYSGYSGMVDFDTEGFQKLLLATAGNQNFAKLQKIVDQLGKAGNISAEDAAKYKSDILKEQAANTPPVIITNNNSTSNKGTTTMIAASNAKNPLNQLLTDY